MIVIHDLGSAVTLTWSTTGSNAAASITQPDGTTASATVSSPSAGSFAAAFLPTQVGRHAIRWTATNPDDTYSDTFDVTPADIGYLCSLDDLRAELNLTTTNTGNDDELRLYLAAATPIIEDLTGPMRRTTYSDQYDGGVQTLILRHSRIISVTTVTEYWGSYAWDLSQAANPAASGQYSYTVDLGIGAITRRTPSGAATFFANGQRNIHVTYTAGAAVVPPNIRLAARRLAAHQYRTSQQGTRPAFGTGDTDVAFTPSGYAVPRSVLELCKPHRRQLGVA